MTWIWAQLNHLTHVNIAEGQDTFKNKCIHDATLCSEQTSLDCSESYTNENLVKV